MRLFSISIIAVAALLLSCATTGPGGEKSLVIIPTSQEVAIGEGMALQVEQQETILADSAWQAYVNDIGQRIVAVCDRKDITYHFTVIESDAVNAFAAPGGYIYFYTGLLKIMDNEAEFAAVAAHEISHVVARHSVKRLQAALGVALAWELVFGDNADQALTTAISIGLGLAFADYSRDNERQADAYGIHYMRQAGYDPGGAIGMFNKLAALGDAGSSDIFEHLARSHPETQERIQNATEQIRQMQPIPADLRIGQQKYQQMLKRLK